MQKDAVTRMGPCEGTRPRLTDTQIDWQQLIWVEVNLAELQVLTASETATGQIISFSKPKYSKMYFGLGRESLSGGVSDVVRACSCVGFTSTQVNCWSIWVR